MEIERKYLIRKLPEDLEQYEKKEIEQAYLCTEPVVRVRRFGPDYYLTYKGKGLMAREEYDLPLTEAAYLHLRQKADGNIIKKNRYEIPLPGGLTAELDLFAPPFAPLIMAEVEFATIGQAHSFCPPEWFGEEVTFDKAYQNVSLSRLSL